MKYLIEEATLTGIADAVREKKGTTDLIQVSNLATEISNIQGGGTVEELTITSNGTYNPPTGIDGFAPVVVNVPQDGSPPESAFNITGSCNYRFAYNNWNWFIKLNGNKITTNNIKNIDYMFGYSSNLEVIPFDINMTSSSTTAGYTFTGCYNLTNIPMINNLKMSSAGSPQMFKNCYKIRNFPEGFGDNWDFSEMKLATYGGMNSFFADCYSLREVPEVIIANCCNKNKSTYSVSYYYLFSGCNSLDEINGLEVSQTTFTSNCFSYTFHLTNRLKNMTFSINEDGTPKTANWKSQTIDLTTGVGYLNYTDYKSYILNYNSGITADKEVKDDATYQALKNDPDWFSCDVNYSRYNHDSAVRTINSLPDTSAYLASNGGTNTIKFKGQSGASTDGGAINTLTEEEIAVATAKGWVVSFV